MPWVGFESTISAGERPKTYALDGAATGTGSSATLPTINPILTLFQMDVLPLTVTVNCLTALHYYPLLFVIAYVRA